MYEEIIKALEEGNPDLAKEYLEERKEDPYSDELAVLQAETKLQLGEKEGMAEVLESAMKENPCYYEFYYLLAGYYYEKNPVLSYLCMENALFLCPKEKEEDRKLLASELEKMIANGYQPAKTAIVIVSYNGKEHMEACLNSIRATTPESAREIVVVDNASTDGVRDYLLQQKDIRLRCNARNEGFPKACNQGMKLASPETDIWLLNNDTRLVENSLFWLRMALYDGEKIGAVGSVSNNVVNYQQVISEKTPLEECLAFGKKNNRFLKNPYRKMLRLIGFSILIRYQVLLEIGFLDEQFTPGNYEDDDFSMRMQLAGYHLRLCKNSFVYHVGSASFGKDSKKFSDLTIKNQRKFVDKWGVSLEKMNGHESYYVGMTPFSKEDSFWALEIGAMAGGNLAYLREEYPNAIISGLDWEGVYQKVGENFDPTICYLKEESYGFPYPDASFDLIYVSLFWEFCRRPKRLLEELNRILKPDGRILFKIQNARNYCYIVELLWGERIPTKPVVLEKQEQPRLLKGEIERLLQDDGWMVEDVGANREDLLLTGKEALLEACREQLQIKDDVLDFQILQYFIRVRRR